MLRFKQFETIFQPKNIDGREVFRKKMIADQVNKEIDRYKLLKQQLPKSSLFDCLIEDIFFAWDQYNDDDRIGLKYNRSSDKIQFDYYDSNFLEYVIPFLNGIGCKFDSTLDQLCIKDIV